jgi:hypothetical protein
MSQTLDRRYGRLLRCYPAGYRADFAEEILDTLLASARPGQRWPDVRQSAALLTAAVRLRLGSRGRTARETWAQGLQLTVVGFLAQSLAMRLWFDVLTYPAGSILSRVASFGRTGIASSVLMLLALPLVLWGRFVPAAALMWAATAGTFLFGQFRGISLFVDPPEYMKGALIGPWVWFLAAAVALTVLATVLRPADRRRSPGWLLALLALEVANLVPEAMPVWGDLPYLARLGVALLVPLLCAAWAFLDTRAATAGVWWMTAAMYIQLVGALGSWSDYRMFRVEAVAAALTILAAAQWLTARRTARL